MTYRTANTIDEALFDALDDIDHTFDSLYEIIKLWTETQKIKVILGCLCADNRFDINIEDPDRYKSIEFYEEEDYTSLAKRFVKEGFFGDIPDKILKHTYFHGLGNSLVGAYGYETIANRTIFYKYFDSM